MLSFTLNNEPVNIADIAPDTTILELLRTRLGRKGTKEGCGSGDCGACTVVVVDDGGYRTLNSCISMAAQLQGKHLITVEGLKADDGSLHPVQQAMVEQHGSQCGFCTPGFIMSLFALYQQRVQDHGKPLSRAQIEQALAGNLCRCTGYEPIIKAAMQACDQPCSDQGGDQRDNQGLWYFEPVAATASGQQLDGYWQPRNREALKAILRAQPQARLVAGATDLGLEITQQLKSLPQLIDLTRVEELTRWQWRDDVLMIGAAVSLHKVADLVTTDWPELAELFERLGSTPIRNQGTIGGNLGTASPIADCPPWLMALAATVVVSDGDEQQSYLLKDFFTGYRQTRLNAGQWIDHVLIPRRKTEQLFRTYKISKRFDDDISTVCVSWLVELETGRIVTARCGLGGVAATPVLVDVSAQLAGLSWNSRQCLELISQELLSTLKPMSDVRASAAYRLALLPALAERFWLETTTSLETRVVAHA